jgi:molybdopterin molybdotransferase/putative molybdopterin biosynthesis protein
VYAKPIITFIPTGDELIPLGVKVPPGKNVESNGRMLEAYIKEWGGIPILYPIVPDDTELLKNTILKALIHSDLVLVCAGSSKGKKDITMDVLEEIGNILVRELGHGPGKHCSLTMTGDKPIIGLPGPAKGAELTAGYYVRAALAFMNHQEYPRLEIVNAILTKDIKGTWIDFIFPIYLYYEDGKYYAKPVEAMGKTKMEGFRASNGKFYCEKGKEIKAGEIIPVELN